MSERCPECGAPIAAGGSCRENLHALLLLEGRIPGGPGAMAHFYAVATYGLQNPIGMNYTVESYRGLRAAVADALDGRATIAQIRGRASRDAARAGRVTRRPGDDPVVVPVDSWPMTVVDVLAVEPTADAYARRVAAWARSVRDALDAAGA